MFVSKNLLIINLYEQEFPLQSCPEFENNIDHVLRLRMESAEKISLEDVVYEEETEQEKVTSTEVIIGDMAKLCKTVKGKLYLLNSCNS